MPLRVSIDETVERAVRAFLAADTTRERGGFLVGRLAARTGDATEVRAFVACPDAPSTAVSLTFRAEEWQLVHACEPVASGAAGIVGWVHSHPSMPVEMSGRDLFIQLHFFSDERQVAWIRDPVDGDEALWHWTDDGIARAERIAVEGARP